MLIFTLFMDVTRKTIIQLLSPKTLEKFLLEKDIKSKFLSLELVQMTTNLNLA